MKWSWWSLIGGVCNSLVGVWIAWRVAEGSPILVIFGIVLALVGVLNIVLVLRAREHRHAV